MMAETVGRSLELFFIDGKPDGMQTAEVFNWTGRGGEKDGEPIA
jgi:hypothetical protein